MKHLTIWLCMAMPSVAAAQSADGQRYPVTGGPVVHAATKSVASWAVWAGSRQLGLKPVPAALLGSLGVFGVAKAIELGKGHRLGPWDTVHDAAWHGLGVAIGRRHWLLAASLSVGAIVLRCQASPRWGC